MITTRNLRIQTIDQIRGIALLGILIFNVQTYTFFAYLRPEQVYALGLDQPAAYAPVQFLIHLLVKGQFYTIYSFLFGLGFYLMWQKNNAAGLDADRIFRRRLWTLLLFGLIHALVFWFGDVLHKYALLGFTLLYFNKKPVAYLVKWITGLLAVMLVIQLVKVLCFPVNPESVVKGRQEFDKVIMQVLDAWQNGTVLQVIGFQKLGVLMSWLQTIEGGMTGIIHFEIMFLLGLVAGKTSIFRRVPEMGRQLMKKAMILFPFALLLKAISCLGILQIHLLPDRLLAWEAFINNLSVGIGTLLLAVVYLIVMGVLLDGRSSRLLIWIGNTGCMGLTNYLAQTLICMLLFYGYSLGWCGRLTLTESFLPVLLIYAFQLLYSNIWLRYVAMGPMEKLWRRLTYGSPKRLLEVGLNKQD